MVNIFLSFIVLFFFGSSNVCFGEDLIFPFTVDQNTKNEDISQFPSEKDIQNDNWFMSAPTRLELLTYIIDQYFKKEVSEYWENKLISIEKYFERQHRIHELVAVRSGVQFDSSKDVFIAWVEIDHLGKPQKPMKEVCGEVLKSVDFVLKGGGFSYHNKILYPFIQGNPRAPEIARIAEKVRKNILVTVSLQAQFDKDPKEYPRDIYTMQCYKRADEKEIHYYKRAFSIK